MFKFQTEYLINNYNLLYLSSKSYATISTGETDSGFHKY